MESRAREFYEQIINAHDPGSHLNRLVDERKPETEFLEFKGASKIPDSAIKQYWSKALSGFSNTEGGVLVWGIRASRIDAPDGGHRKVDAASELDLAPSPASLAQLLKDVLLESLIEPLRGVEIREVPSESDGKGFVVCLIPEGENKPYRAQLDPASQYYQRIADNFVLIPHSLLKSLFYPRSEPDLRVAIRLQGRDDLPGKPGRGRAARYKLLAQISNEGSRSAREVLISVKSNYDGDFGACGTFTHISGPRNHWQFTGRRTIHPQERDVACFSGHVIAPFYLSRASDTVWRDNDTPEKLVFSVSMYSDDASPRHQTIEYDAKRVQQELKDE